MTCSLSISYRHKAPDPGTVAAVRVPNYSQGFVCSPDSMQTVVRMVFEHYTVRGLSIGAITRLLNEQGVPTRKGNFTLGALDGLGDAAQPCL